MYVLRIAVKVDLQSHFHLKIPPVAYLFNTTPQVGQTRYIEKSVSKYHLQLLLLKETASNGEIFLTNEEKMLPVSQDSKKGSSSGQCLMACIKLC